MKNRKLKIILLLVGIILFLFWQIILLDRMDQIRWMSQAEGNRVEQSLSRDIRKLDVESIDDRLRSLESAVEMGQDQRLVDLERKVERLEDILLEMDGVDIFHGKIMGVAYTDQWELDIETEEDVEFFSVSTSVKPYFIDTYTFVLVNGEILHIYQGWDH